MDDKSILRRSLTDVVAGRLARSILDGTLKPGSQLLPERELVRQYGVSRSTVRESLKKLEEMDLIEGKHGVGWFVKAVNAGNLAKTHEIAYKEDAEDNVEIQKTTEEALTGPKRLPVTPEKPLQIPNLQKDRLGTFSLISWWEREKVAKAKVMVVDAGALGNEVIKNLVLMGIGNLFIVDFDTIEMANLSRSVLFRESDASRKKAEVAAARAKELNPNVNVQYFHGDITNQLGLGIFRRMDVVIGCLDNREARLAVNRFCYWVNKPWVDGAIQEFLGLMRVFIPGEGACFECTLTEQARKDLSLRYSCPLLARENVLLGKVPTTPTIASIIAGMQAQDALKIIHGKPVEAGKVVHFNGMTNEMHTTAYKPREDCESHWVYGDITELPLQANTTTVEDFLKIIKSDMGDDAVVELDQELILSLSCPQCNTNEKVMRPISNVGFKEAHCPICGNLREMDMTHTISGDETFLKYTLASIGIPALHIIRVYNAREFRFYELAGDADQALHFQHFAKVGKTGRKISSDQIKLKEPVDVKDSSINPAHGRIRIDD